MQSGEESPKRPRVGTHRSICCELSLGRRPFCHHRSQRELRPRGSCHPLSTDTEPALTSGLLNILGKSLNNESKTVKSQQTGHETIPVMPPSPHSLTSCPQHQVGNVLTVVITRIRLEGAEGLDFRVAAFVTVCEAGHLACVFSPFVFRNSKRKQKQHSVVQPSTLALSFPTPFFLEAF